MSKIAQFVAICVYLHSFIKICIHQALFFITYLNLTARHVIHQ